MIIFSNSILMLQPSFYAFMRNTRLCFRPLALLDGYKNVTSFKPPNIYLPLNITSNRLRWKRLSTKLWKSPNTNKPEDLECLIIQSFGDQKISWFIYFTITLIMLLMTIYIFCNYGRWPHRINITPGPNNPSSTPRLI